MRNSDIQSRSIFLLKQLGVAAFYALLIHVDHRFFESGTTVSSFEAASGFALGMLLIGGKRYAWGVFLGAILINTTAAPFWKAVTISSGDALEALCGAWLLTRDNRFDPAIRSLRDYLRLILLGGVAGIGIGANFGVAALLVSGFVIPDAFFRELVHWWTGDILGVILVTPLMLVFQHTRNDWHGAKRLTEAALLLGLTFVAGQIIFLGWFHSTNSLFQLLANGYWMFLFIALVAVRLGTRGTVVALNITAAQALLGAYQGIGYFAYDIAKSQLANYWCYTVILSVVGMALSTYIAERKNSEELLRQSEEKLRAYLDNISDTIWLIDANLNIAYVSSSVTHLLGVLPDELAGRPSALIIHPDDMGVVVNAQRYVMEHPGESHTIQYRVSHKDGRWIYVESTGVNMQDNPAIKGVLVTMRDITGRKASEQALQNSENRFRALVETTSDWIWEVDENAIYTYASPKIRDILGYEAAGVIGKTPFDFMPPDEARRVADIFGPIAAARKPFTNLENTNLHKDGHPVIIETSGVPIVDQEGKFCGYRGVDRDITGRKQTQDNLRKLSMAVEQSPSSIVITDLNANIEYVNQAFVKETGYRFEEAIGQNPRILNSGKNWKAIYEEMWACLIRGEVWKGELINRRKDGSEYIESALISPVRQPDGRVTHYLAIKENITQRKENELKMERLTRIYHVLSQVNEGIVRAHDEKGLFAAVCNAAIVSGLFRFAWIGMLDEQIPSVIPVVYAGVEEGYLDRLNILLDDEGAGDGPTGRAMRGCTHIICQDIENDPGMGQWRDDALRRGYRASGVFPLYRAGSLVGAINVYAAEAHFFTRDIIRLMLELAADISFALDVFAEKKRRELAEDEVRQINIELEHRVQERTRQLEYANKELEAFSYSVSHDLRAPLRSIDGFSRVLSKNYYSQLDATGKDWLERVCRASQRMGHLIDDMLQLSQVARSPLKREPVDLSGIAGNVVDDLCKAHPERRVRFVLQQDLIIHADPGLLGIVMDNLLGNAWKYTGKRNGAEIEFGMRDINDEPTFFVRDNGAGFNMDYAHKLFGAFQRLHGDNEFEGSGIGLATVQRIIHRHYGRVWAESSEGQGATFYFTVPQKTQGA